MDQELVYPNVEGEELILSSQNDANDRQLQAAELMVSLSSCLPGGGQGVAMETQSVSSSSSHLGTTYNYPVIVTSYSVGSVGVSETMVATETITNDSMNERGDHTMGYSAAENCIQHFQEYVQGSDSPDSTMDRKFAVNHHDHLSNNAVIVMSSGVGGESFMVENTEDDVELGEIEYIQDGDIITISEGNTSSTFTDIVSKSQYGDICNPSTSDGNQISRDCNHTTIEGNQISIAGDHTTTEGNLMSHDGYHSSTEGNQIAIAGNHTTTEGYQIAIAGNHTTTEGNLINFDGNQAVTESNHATNVGYQITLDSNQATAESIHATNVGYQITIDGNPVKTDRNQANNNSRSPAHGISMDTSNWTHGVIIDNSVPEIHAGDEDTAYLDGETLHVSLKGGTGQSLTLINKRRLEQMTQGSEVLVVEPKKVPSLNPLPPRYAL